MRFRSDKPIFQQIVEQIEDQILTGELVSDQRIPAVRDYAITVEVNPNTVVRSFLELEQSGVIFKKRGLGYFVSSDARQIVMDRRKTEFLEHELPEIVKKMHLLGIDLKYLQKLYESSNGKG
jgi:GntR family transcriptional regulator